MGNVIHRGKGSFTFVENTIFFDHGLSAKAKGIYCQIRSLENNPEWVFTIKGFASLVRDGADAVSAGIKELESSGYIIRARKRSENGRFLKAEEATWITLDDPAMHAQVAAELKAEGFAVLSEFTREPPANVESEPQEKPIGPENAQVCARTGKPVSGKATSGESAPINYSSDKALEPDKEPLSYPPGEGAQEAKRRKEGFREYRKGEFPEAFERLCAMSIKPVASLRFKRDCLAAWERRVETRRSVIRSQMAMGGSLPPEEQVLAACEENGPYKRYIAACEERHGRYLKVFDLFRNPSKGLERAQEETLTAGAMPFGGRLP